MKIGQQMLIFQKILKDEISIFSSPFLKLRILKEKKGGGGKPWNCEIGQQMLKFRKIIKCSNPHTSSPIFIYSVKSIKIISIMHNWHVLERNNQYSSYFDTHFWKNLAKYQIGLKWTDEEKGTYIFWTFWNGK